MFNDDGIGCKEYYAFNKSDAEYLFNLLKGENQVTLTTQSYKKEGDQMKLITWLEGKKTLIGCIVLLGITIAEQFGAKIEPDTINIIKIIAEAICGVGFLDKIRRAVNKNL